MTDKAFASDSSEMLNKTMDAIAREIGEMNPDDPVRAQRLQELCALSQLSRSFKSEQNKIIDQRMGELAREIVELPPEHPRRAQIVGRDPSSERTYIKVTAGARPVTADLAGKDREE